MAFSLRLDGLTYSQIAREMGISRSSLSGYFDRHGVKTDPQYAYHNRTAPERDLISPGCLDYEVPDYQRNDDRKHLTLMLAALREARTA